MNFQKLPKYQIKISYTTGNSFESEDEERFLDLTWENVEVAKENLRRIASHYEMYKDIEESYSKKKKPEQWYKESNSKSWFVNSPKLFCINSNCAINEKDKDKVGKDNWEYRPDTHIANYCINLITDDGTQMRMGAFWRGHFQTLNEAEIEVDNSDMKISFR